MGTALKSVTAHLLTEFWLQNMRGMFIVALKQFSVILSHFGTLKVIFGHLTWFLVGFGHLIFWFFGFLAFCFLFFWFLGTIQVIFGHVTWFFGRFWSFKFLVIWFFGFLAFCFFRFFGLLVSSITASSNGQGQAGPESRFLVLGICTGLWKV